MARKKAGRTPWLPPSKGGYQTKRPANGRAVSGQQVTEPPKQAPKGPGGSSPAPSEGTKRD